MTFMQKFIERMETLGVAVSSSGDNWMSTPVGVFTQPEADRILYAPNALLDSPGLTSWIALTAVQVAKELDPAVTVFPATECFPISVDYTQYEMDPTKVADQTTKVKNMRVLQTAQNLLNGGRSQAANLMQKLVTGDQKIILPESKVITDV